MNKKKIILLFRNMRKNILGIFLIVALGTLFSCEGEHLGTSVQKSSIQHNSQHFKVRKQFEPDPIPPIPKPDNKL